MIVTPSTFIPISHKKVMMRTVTKFFALSFDVIFANLHLVVRKSRTTIIGNNYVFPIEQTVFVAVIH